MNTKQRIEKISYLGNTNEDLAHTVNLLIEAHNSSLDLPHLPPMFSEELVKKLVTPTPPKGEEVTGKQPCTHQNNVKCANCDTQNSEWAFEERYREKFLTKKKLKEEDHRHIEGTVLEQDIINFVSSEKKESYEAGYRNCLQQRHLGYDPKIVERNAFNQALDKAVEEIDFLILSMGDRDIFKIAKEFMVELKEKLIGMKLC